MRSTHFVIAAAVAAALSGTAMAQTATGQTATGPTATGQTAMAPLALSEAIRLAGQSNSLAPSAAAQTSTVPVVVGETRTNFMATGYVGSNFSTNINDVDLDRGTSSSVEIGGQFAYLWRGIVGAEGLLDFAPGVGMDRLLPEEGLLFEDDHNINAYMANAIGAIPLGSEGRYQPFLSGGFGTIQFRGDVFDFEGISSFQSQSRFGGNIGGGLMAFAGDHLGIRGDVRYYRAKTDESISQTFLAEELTRALLSGLSFWRANVGLAVRW